jgi:hypothetical protein
MPEQGKLCRETENRFSDFTEYIKKHETQFSCQTAPTLTVVLRKVRNNFLYLWS